MKIVLSGVETNNKGAELMLYAILQEIERKYPDAEVYLPFQRCLQGLNYIKTNLDFRYTPYSKPFYKLHVRGILRKLHLPESFCARVYIKNNAEWFIDASGFAFGDQWEYDSDKIRMWEKMLAPLHRRGCKVVFLPQAFGPVEKNETCQALSTLNKYADLLMPREQKSYDYLQKSGVVDMNKVRKFTDFTSLVEGEFPEQYDHLRDGICVIPNMQMIRKEIITYNNYIYFLTAIILEGKKSGHPVYLLNHEGVGDAKLCLKCKEAVGGSVEAVTDLNALQVKGLISSAYLVITSRFHGLASALNSGVPSFATSWSHKYEELYQDYELDNFVLPIDDLDSAIDKVKVFFNKERNLQIRQHLARQLPKIKEQSRNMWNAVWRV